MGLTDKLGDMPKIMRGKSSFSLVGCSSTDGKMSATVVAEIDEPDKDNVAFVFPARCLPYIPDLSEGSQFQQDGGLHKYSFGEEGYAVARNGKFLQQVFLDGKLIFDRERDGADYSPPNKVEEKVCA